MDVPRDLVAELEETARLAAGELDHHVVTQPVDRRTANRLIRRSYLAGLLREYAERLRGLLGSDDHPANGTG
jgi:hypothetical protein